MNLRIKEKFQNIIKNIDIFHPYILIVFITLFVLISIPMLYFSEELPRPSFQVYYVIISGILFFVLGVNFPEILSKLSKKFEKRMKTLKNIKIEALPPLPSFSTNSYFKTENNKKQAKNFYNKLKSWEFIISTIVLIGIILQLINFGNLGGIPLFSGVLKANAATKIWLFSYIFFIIGINILLAKYNRKIYYLLLVIGLGLFALTGYRTTPIAILLSVFITLYYSRTNMKLKYQILFGILISSLLIIVGFIAVQAIEWQQWRLNALELISYRAGFTLNILDRTTYLAGSTHGKLFYYTLTGFFKSVDPRVIVGQTILGENHSITSTIFGPAILDFGWVGMFIQMFLIGFILKLLYIIQKHLKSVASAIYGIILAQTIIWIETGPTDLVVWLFYILGIIVIIYYLYNIDNYSTSRNSLSRNNN
jgi:oligosaccharide repeat unit polymerase